MITDRSRFDFAGPTGDHGHPDASFVEGPLLSLHDSARIVDSVEALGGPVVGGEEHQGILEDFCFLSKADLSTCRSIMVSMAAATLASLLFHGLSL